MSSAQDAITHIRHLAETIGSRPTGSANEARALEYTESILQNAGLTTTRHPVTGIRPHTRVRWLGIFIITLLTATVLIVDITPLPLLATILIVRFIIIPYRLNWGARPVPNGLTSFNVSAEQAPTGEKKSTLVLGAHIDTAVAAPYHRSGWRKIMRRYFGFSAIGRAFMALLLLTFLRIPLGVILGEDTAESIEDMGLWVIKAYFVLIWLYLMFTVYERLTQPIVFAPGANDNASGVGAVLALADHFKDQPPAHVALRYLIFCAEEVGLIGSARYAEALSPQEKAQLYMLNFDMVATGATVRHVRAKTSPRLNEWLRESGVQKGSFFGFGSSDYRSFLKKGVRAAGLYNTGDKMVFQVYHTTEDVMDYIQAPALEKVLESAKTLVACLDSHIALPSATLTPPA